MKKVISLLILFVLILCISCSKDEEQVVNTVPIIKAQTFSVAENVNDTFVIGTLIATDANQDPLKFSLKTDAANLFEITEDGKISLLAGKSLDFETKSSYTVTAQVSDGKDKAEAQVTITVTDIDENTAPVINAQEFTVAEDITDTTEIGAVTATDAEGNTLSFSITTNDNDLFEITNDGKLSLANGKSLDFETTTSHTITVEVTDGSLTAYNTITIKVTDVDENANTDAFITVWKTVTPNEEVAINITQNFTYNYTIDWGDGTVEANQSSRASHVYANSGNHTVTITGTFPTMRSPGNKLVTVKQWGTQEWKSMENFFSNATGLETIEATDVPDLSNVTSMVAMFIQASNFNGNINNWDVSNVTNMQAMFYLATNFNQDLNNWNVSNVTNMGAMFNNASKFNGNISNWDVSNVTQMANIFNRAKVFNQNISNWDVSSVTNMQEMFSYAELFNQDLNNWNVSNVTTMAKMFDNARKFNGNISNWDVSNVTTMQAMFLSTNEFNQDISNWNVSNVTNMISMFANAAKFNANIGNWNVSNVTNMTYIFQSTATFNQDISNWNISGITNMTGMFYHSKEFNQDISNWDVSNVTSMRYMFSHAKKFNQNISNWDVSNVTDMTSMFSGADKFNQDISNWDMSNVASIISMFSLATNFSQDLGNWNITKVAGANDIFSNSSMTTNNNYTKTLIGWSKLATVPANLNLGTNAGQTYCTNYSADAATARDFLINTKGWTINDTVSNTCQ